MNKNLSLEIYKNTLDKKNNKYIHKSFSQKNFNSNNNNKNKYTINIQTENNHYIPSKQTIINYNKNNICITNNEEFQIIPNKKTKAISNINTKNNYNNNNEKNLTEQNTSNIEFNPMPIKINIKVNKKEKDNNEHKEKRIKEIKKENIYSLSKTKFEIKKNENIKNFILKCNKNRILLRQKEIKKTVVNISKDKEKDKDKDKDKEINNDKIYNNIKIKKRIHKNSSQEDVMKQPNKNIQTKVNQKIEKNDKKNMSIRNRYKVKYKNK